MIATRQVLMDGV